MSIETQLQATSVHCITLEHILIITYGGVKGQKDFCNEKILTQIFQNKYDRLFNRFLTPSHKFLGIYLSGEVFQ